MAQCLRSASRSATCSCQPTGTSRATGDRKSTRLNSSHDQISYAVFCLKKKNNLTTDRPTAQANARISHDGDSVQLPVSVNAALTYVSHVAGPELPNLAVPTPCAWYCPV